MSRGKHLGLSEARKTGKLDRYAKKNPSKGDRHAFNRTLAAMAAGKKSAKAGTSKPRSSAGSSGT